MQKTIEEIVKYKAGLEKDILELLRDFQIASGCSVERVELTKSSTIGSSIPDIIVVILEVHLPRR